MFVFDCENKNNFNKWFSVYETAKGLGKGRLENIAEGGEGSEVTKQPASRVCISAGKNH